ncbi:MAG: hypothetical protein CMJ22_02320 [Phycisphaerae bacterium]|nr:hypothetical protein [Phycisphaerae bacterium]MCP4835261.1 hypothetical protein [Phycisphaera sp.]
MPKEPPNFDCRDAIAVLLFRLRDWCWPVAIAVAVTIPILGGTGGGTYKVGSLTYYANTPCAVLTFFLVIFIAGLRWCWVGRIRAHGPGRCRHCGYRLDWVEAGAEPQRCPECGEATSATRPARRISIARLLVDLPGVLAMLVPIGFLVMILLAVVGLLDLD